MLIIGLLFGAIQLSVTAQEVPEVPYDYPVTGYEYQTVSAKSEIPAPINDWPSLFGTSEESLEQYTEVMKNIELDETWSSTIGVATSYAPLDNQSGMCADSNPNVTSIGMRPGPEVIAVDPKRIPYHSKIVVVYSNGTVKKGIAGDTGGALRRDSEYHIDIFSSSYQEAMNHGRQHVLILWQPTIK